MVSFSLLLFVPVSLILKYWIGASPLWVFVTAALAIAALANWVRRSTEQLAGRTGPAIGGLLNVSFGSLAEFFLALSVLATGNTAVVRAQAQITGSIIGTSLLGLGLAILVGSWGRAKQTFRRDRAGLLSSLMILTIIALLLPAIFHYEARSFAGGAGRPVFGDEELSLTVSAVRLFLYGANVVYTLSTRRDAFASEESRVEVGRSLPWALTVLIASTMAIVAEAILVADVLAATAQQLHFSSLFLGVIVLALGGTATDLFAAAYFARQDKMELVLEICIGSAVQVALLVAPLLVIISWFIGRPMTLVFSNPLELFAIGAAIFTVNAIARDGETTWFEGVLLVGVYVLFGLAFFFVDGR